MDLSLYRCRRHCRQRTASPETFQPSGSRCPLARLRQEEQFIHLLRRITLATDSADPISRVRVARAWAKGTIACKVQLSNIKSQGVGRSDFRSSQRTESLFSLSYYRYALLSLASNALGSNRGGRKVFIKCFSLRVCVDVPARASQLLRILAKPGFPCYRPGTQQVGISPRAAQLDGAFNVSEGIRGHGPEFPVEGGEAAQHTQASPSLTIRSRYLSRLN
jgi:hypothetical protein